ncbi:MAG: hypothetical protein AB7R55_13015 [Gemmatimonadales bacterium]
MARARCRLAGWAPAPELLAGLRGEPCPPDGNPFRHLEGCFPNHASGASPEVRAALAWLSPAERRRLCHRHGLDPRQLDPDVPPGPRPRGPNA